MNKYLYKKSKTKNIKGYFRLLSVVLFFAGVLSILYIFFPLVSWQVYFAPVFASQDLTAPIPKTTIVSSSTLTTLISDRINSLGIDYTNAQNWFPYVNTQKGNMPISSYTISIPKLFIENARVSTTDNNLSSHLVNYSGTAIPPEKGTSVIFGHSTLPQLFNSTDYKTIFATAYKLEPKDGIFVSISNVTYQYKILTIRVVEPTDTSIFTQQYDDSYITLVTCTPPGTTWKRLIINARLEKI